MSKATDADSILRGSSAATAHRGRSSLVGKDPVTRVPLCTSRNVKVALPRSCCSGLTQLAMSVSSSRGDEPPEHAGALVAQKRFILRRLNRRGIGQVQSRYPRFRG